MASKRFEAERKQAIKRLAGKPVGPDELAAIADRHEKNLRLYCECCGKVLDPKKSVALELDQRIGEYHDFGNVPESSSQGWFDFGVTCAKKARAKAKVALEAIGA